MFPFLLAAALVQKEAWATHQPSSKSRACGQLPIAALESALGAKAGAPAGSDQDKFSSCRVTVGGANVKLEYHQAGQPGLPSDVKMGLAGATAMMSGGDIKLIESKDFGDIGCLQAAIAVGAKGIVETSCFMPKGYYTLSIGRDGAAIPMDTVKGLLEKFAAAR